MSLAQKDQLLEIGSRVRLGKPIICGRLSVSRDKSRTFRLMKFEQIFSLRCQNRTSGKPRSSPQTFIRMTFPSSLLDTSARSAGSSRTATIPSGLREWWSRTGSNRRHPACKAGALPAELRPLIPFVEEIDNPCGLPATTLRVALEMVGLGGLEPPTSRLSSARSNQLSYKP